MEPPICFLCDRDQRECAGLKFELIQFRDYEPLDHPGHPKGLLWFCEDHLPLAQRLEQCESGEALRRLRRSERRPAWWNRIRKWWGPSD